MELEHRIQKLLAGGDLRGAATKAIEGYGPEVFGFLATLVRDPSDASDVFSQACEDLWQGLARFERRCSMRTWFYTLARHAAARFRRAPHRRAGRRVPLSEVTEVANRVRTGTLRYLRTEAKDGVAKIRDALQEDDRTLLVLRVDRGLSWKDIARVLAADDPSDPVLDREAARLRKRFQIVKGEIRSRAKEAGLWPPATSKTTGKKARTESARVPPSQNS
jgi:RNA polymerase sigma-70 factor (ECF subfamily)